MCASLGKGDNDHTIEVAELDHCEVRLERRSRLPGYCIVVWKLGHIGEATELDPQAASNYWAEVLDVSRSIQDVFMPVKMNLLTLGNWVPHLHTHVVPRYADDPAPGGPIAWDAMFTDAPIPADTLAWQARAIRGALKN
jgi:diadenosine tetraphosphate (Ap4A) HIT family hydrolase